MKTLALSLTALFFFFAGVSTAWAAPTCSSSFCGNNGGGSQCEIAGDTYTCGECMENTNVLYSGDLTADQANHACNCQHNPGYSCGKMMLPLEEAEALELTPVEAEREGGNGDAPAPQPEVRTAEFGLLACL